MFNLIHPVSPFTKEKVLKLLKMVKNLLIMSEKLKIVKIINFFLFLSFADTSLLIKILLLDG